MNNVFYYIICKNDLNLFIIEVYGILIFIVVMILLFIGNCKLRYKFFMLVVLMNLLRFLL